LSICRSKSNCPLFCTERPELDAYPINSSCHIKAIKDLQDARNRYGRQRHIDNLLSMLNKLLSFYALQAFAIYVSALKLSSRDFFPSEVLVTSQALNGIFFALFFTGYWYADCNFP
jgi:hypothetical protein